MNRIEPNLLLAVTTGLALALLVLTSVVYGPPFGGVRYPMLAVVCSVLFVVGNGFLMKRMNRTAPPMIHAEARGTAMWSSLFPLVIILAAAVPMVWPAHDYGLLVIIGAIWFGLTVQSALRAHSV